MRKRIISALLCIAMTGTVCASLPVTAGADEPNTPQYQITERQMEKLNRGLIAVKVSNGVYLSWRLLGTESLVNQAFDIYKNGTKLTTTGVHDATCYTDSTGTVNDKYVVVPEGASAAGEPEVTPNPNNRVNNTDVDNSFSYFDVPIVMPADETNLGGGTSTYKRTGKFGESIGGANDASVGDLDGDGDYEIVLKWDPQDSKDAASGGYTGHVYLDAYEISENNGGYMWRIDLGQNLPAGAHYTQFIVYDFDGDGKSELATQTAPGSCTIDKDGNKHYVTEVGDTEEIRNADNSANNTGTGGRGKGKNMGPDYLTIFDGETGLPLKTTAGIPLGDGDQTSVWGDSNNRAFRYLAGVAYLDGVHPCFITSRGYYARAVIRAYTWDGEEFTMLWEHDSGSKANAATMYGQGNHNQVTADVDNDGKDEIVWGSATLDDNGKDVIDNILMGHGDAMHVSDFDNDGWQEVFSVKEDTSAKMTTGANLRRPGGPNKNSSLFSLPVEKGSDGKWPDVGRGVMGNIDDAYAAENPDARALGWTSYHPSTYDLKGNAVNTKPNGAGKGSFDNFLVYWDSDLGSELLDANIIRKYNAATGQAGRFYGLDGYTFDASVNNSTKRNYSLVADLWGDWREEVIMPIGDETADNPRLRIYTSTIPTEYRLTTLMHDCQYREAIAWQNVTYNQPPHTSYYIGSAALATDESGNKLNYLAPATPFTKVKYATTEITNPVTGISLSKDSVRLEKGESELIQAIIEPDNADKKTVTWSTSDANVATVSNGTIKAVGRGTATITATAKDTTLSQDMPDGVFKATCQVEVYATDVTGLNFPGYDNITIMQGGTTKITANVVPSYATVKTINWSSTNPNVATVDSDGVVTGVGSGSAIIRAVTAEGGFMGEKIVSVAGKVEDKTGTEKFTATGEGNGTTISTTEKSVTVTQKEAADGISAQRSFEVLSDNKATLSFVLNTGGQKINNGGWGWTGHEYSLGFKLLGEDDSNILTISQAFTSGAQATMYTAGTDEAKNISGDWKEIVSGSNSPLDRSAARWYMTLEFDYNSDTLTASVRNDPDSETGKPSAAYQKTINLNGAKFKTLQMYTTKDGNGTITVSPSISNVSYSYAVPSDGVGSKLYDKATIDDNKWTDADIEEWTAVGGTPAVTANGFGFVEHKPGGSYSASRTFTLEQDALVTYDADWHYNNYTTRESVVEYIQLGPVKIAVGNGGGSADTEFTGQFFTKVSLDGGTTWCDFDNDGKADNISPGSAAELDRNVSLVIDTKTNTIKSLCFGDTEITNCKDKVLTGDPDYTNISIGLDRNGGTGDIDYINTIKNLTVLQFVEGAEQPNDPVPEIPDPQGDSVKITGVNANTVDVSYSTAEEHDSVTLIGALYDGDKLVEVKVNDIVNPAATVALTDSFTFEADASNYDVKVFLWNSVSGMTPICAAAAAAPNAEQTPEQDAAE